MRRQKKDRNGAKMQIWPLLRPVYLEILLSQLCKSAKSTYLCTPILEKIWQIISQQKREYGQTKLSAYVTSISTKQRVQQ